MKYRGASRDICRLRLDAGLPCKNCIGFEDCGVAQGKPEPKIRTFRYSSDDMAALHNLNLSNTEVSKLIRRSVKVVREARWRLGIKNYKKDKRGENP